MHVTVCALTLVYIAVLVGAAALRTFRSDRAGRIKFLKNFKRGRFALIYIAAIPIYMLAYLEAKQPLDAAFWNSFRACIDLVLLRYDYAPLLALAEAELFFRVTADIFLTVVLLNAVLFALSVAGQWLRNACLLLSLRLSRKKVLVILGTDETSLTLLRSAAREPSVGRAVLMGELTPELREAAFVLRAVTVQCGREEDVGEKLLRLFGDLGKRKVSVIVNERDEERNLIDAKQLFGLIEREHLTEIPLLEERGLAVYVFGTRGDAAVYQNFTEDSMGILRFVSRHGLIAADFTDKYPLTRYMTARELDFGSATVREGIEINVFFIGFGKLSESIFLSSVANHQFLTKSGGKLKAKPVRYHLYDKRYPAGRLDDAAAVYSGELVHGYFRYEAFLKYYEGREDEFLPFPDPPAEVHYDPYDVNHPAFYDTLRAEITAAPSFSYIIVSFGSDVENLELAQKLGQKIREWGDMPVRIFARVRNGEFARAAGSEFPDVQIFGTEDGCVYDAASILGEEVERMAKRKHLLYAACRAATEGETLSEEELERLARTQWYKRLKNIQRESNLSACLSLRTKFQLAGYDIAREGEDVSEEFERAYEAGDARTPSGLRVEGKEVWSYSNAEQQRDSLRRTYTVQEHLRWCASMITCGVVPASRAEIASPSGGKALERRIHGNLTTMEGLVEYRRIMAKVRGTSEEETDVIRYDYQLMDDAVWLLHACGYRVVRKKIR